MNDIVLPLPKATLLQNSLSLLSGAQANGEMSVAMIKGLCGNLTSTQAMELSQKVESLNLKLY